jgi:hypothetical protein
MQLSVTGKQLEVGNAPRPGVETEQKTAFVVHYPDGAQEADIVFSREVPVFGAHTSLPIGEEFNSSAPLKRMPSVGVCMTLARVPKQLRRDAPCGHRMNNLPEQA